MATLMESARKTSNERQEYAPAHPVETFMVSELRGWILPRLGEALAESPEEARVLDVGCGSQPFRRTIESQGGLYTSLDVSQNPKNNVDHIGQIDAELPGSLLSCGGFDILLCTEVLEHVADWGKAFENLFRLGGKGCRLIVTCPFFYPLHAEPYDYWRPTEHSLRYFAEGAGFVTQSIEKGGDLWSVLGTVFGNHFALPKDRKFRSRLASRAANLILKYGFRILRSGWLQRHCISVPTSLNRLYLTNLAVFVKE